MNHADNRVRVVIADNHHFFRDGLRSTLELADICVLGEATDAPEAISLAEELQPDVVVIDLDIPRASGVTALRRIAAASPDTRLLVLASTVDEEAALEALQVGVCGYLLKDTRAEELLQTVGQLSRNQVILSPEIARALVTRAALAEHGDAATRAAVERAALSPRERDVLRLMVAGADNAAIGLELSISRHTVKQHVTNIFEKLGVRTRVEAAVYAVRSRLV